VKVSLRFVQVDVKRDTGLDGTSNNHYEDFNGWGSFHIPYYRGLGRAPCSHTAFQRMVIACGAGGWSWSTVQSQVLVQTIGTTSLTNSRGSVVMTTPY